MGINRFEELAAEARGDAQHADQKASLLLASIGVVYGVVVAAQLAGDWSPFENPGTFTPVLWSVGCGIAALAVLAAGAAVWPRYQVRGAAQYGPNYWGHFATYKDVLSLQSALAQNEDTVERSDLQKLLRLSRIVRVKYALVRLSLICAALAAFVLGFLLPVLGPLSAS